ncbi:M4 family metallopeptidase [Mycobacterium sp. URHB0044]|uniref:M4 family metallopeptidase n=1 Tax=Mycobacterium sp. URHB0044 TaxID=1380386 RepID=UPI0012DF0220|nr:M4 family metallopeptidase [Mycobacterium sp. URHB0044]
MGNRSKPCAQWFQVGVVAVGLGAAAAAGHGLASASPADAADPAVNTASDSVSAASDSPTGDVSASASASADGQPTAAATTPDTAATTARSDTSQESTKTSLDGGPTSTLSAQQNTSHDDPDSETATAPTEHVEMARPVASPGADEEAPDVDSTAVDSDGTDVAEEKSTVADERSTVANDYDVAEPAAKSFAGPKTELPSVPTTFDGKASSNVANVKSVADETGVEAAPAAQASSSAVTPFPTAPVDLPPNPVRTLVAAFLGLFGFNPHAVGPSSNPLNPVLELAWGFYRRIETGIAEAAYTIFGIKLITTTVPTTDTGIDLLGNTRDLNVVWVDGQGFVGYRLVDKTRDIAIYETTNYTTVDGTLYPASPPGSVVAKGPSAWDPSAVSAYANVVIVYDFYENTLYRTSFDDDGAAIRITVVSNALDNAYWYRSYREFVFGHDFEAALDVVAHEYTHAVMDSVVASQNGGLTLGRNGESRALEESYADIMGSLIEGKSGADEWLLGEDYGCSAPSASTGCAIRNLADPSAFGDPENYSDYDSDADEHFNSTIFSFAAFKMMTDARTTGISRDTWASVYYHSLYDLPAGASFADARSAVMASAETLGFTDDELQAITAAFDAVGIMPSATAAGAVGNLNSVLA